MSKIAQFLLGGWVIRCHNCAKRSLGCLVGRIGCWICTMRNPDWFLAARIMQCAIPDGKDYKPKDWIAQFPRPTITVLQKCAKQSLRPVLGTNAHFWRGRQNLPSQIAQSSLSEAESWPRLAQLADGKLKANKTVNAW